MPDLPIRRLILYKHGVGYFERRGPVDGELVRLSFPREAMDDVLKSLVALDLAGGHVLGVEFETPADRAAQLARGSIHLSDNRSLLDLVRDLRGRRARLVLADDEQVEGLIVGVDLDEARPLRMPLVSIYHAAERRVRSFAVRQVRQLEILDDRAAEDLDYFLRAAQSEEDRRVATLRLGAGQHDMLVGYVAPAPAWRVSYRILVEKAKGQRQKAEEGASQAGAVADQASATADDTDGSSVHPSAFILLQGWGLFDNQLDEDLAEVELTLVAGMPVSFRYRLYEPHTPERPLVADEERTVAEPIFFAGAAAADAVAMEAAAPMAFGAPPPPIARKARAITMDAAEASTQSVGAGEERGALFQYHVAHPVSVARGQSAMVPIVGQRLHGRKELLYNGQKLPSHPVASLRMGNSTGLTLERGPVTVLDEGDYVGEAVLPFTRADAELIVPYAVELGVTVREEHDGERQLGGLSIRDALLVVQEWDVRRTTYQIKSTLAQPSDVTIEQAMLDGYALFESAAPSEQSQGHARWVVGCPAGAETVFRVQQRRPISRREQVRNLSHKQLADFLRRRFLDQATYAALEGVLSIYGQIDQRQQRLHQIEQERQRAYERQRQAQGSLTPLGASGEEGQLRSRYVALLGQLENQLAALADEEQRLTAEIAGLEGEARAALAALSG